MKYVNIILHCAGEQFLMEEEKLRAITQFLMFKARGGNYSAEEIEARIGKGETTAIAKANGDIAVLPIHGVISQRLSMMEEISGGVSTEEIAAQFRAYLADDSIKMIILNFDTPGGTVSGVPELGQEIFDSRGTKPIIAHLNPLAASAGYWLAAQADEIIATPSGRGGSIGVYTVHEDLSKMYEMEGINPTLIRSGEHKIAANSFGPLSESALADLQQSVIDTHKKFMAAVGEGRKISVSKVKSDFGDGKVFSADQMLERGMIDRIETLPQTLERFGMSVHPYRKKRVENAQAIDVIRGHLKSGVQISDREWDRAFKSMGFSNSEVDLAVRSMKKGGHSQGTEGQVAAKLVKSLNDMSGELADLRKHLGLGE